MPVSGVVKVRPQGLLDIAYAESFDGNGFVYSMVFQPSGKLLVGGYFNMFNGQYINSLARLNTNGTVDLSFNFKSGIRGSVVYTAQAADGDYYAGGLSKTYEITPDYNLVRLNADGTLDPGFNIGSGFSQSPGLFLPSVRSIVVQPDGKIIVSGYFFNFNGVAVGNIVRLNSNGSLDPSFNPG